MNGEITGRKVLAGFVGAFGVIIAVNLFMAYNAVSTFPGVVEHQPYIASQTFDADRKAQIALGWKLTPTYDAERGALLLSVRETATGLPGDVAELSVLVGRATDASHDIRPEFQRVGDGYVASARLDPGYWILMVDALAGNGTKFKQRLRIFVKG
jgi:nitrogen fixation protein FixH